ncbi:carbohydrate porin [Waterburya agarophytonicola K14]|uniref:Carbohydrate porin n=1 Tax=Waterburya agarophytonicola KI4 TaxID=2874699 RepID=A0A964BS71_9CYAN|nr:iron uptake porin [Waterburya agarophytonicola]MCC0178485.1 carbohydrate porin [Waterburya agarophytonicola KI4]
MKAINPILDRNLVNQKELNANLFKKLLALGVNTSFALSIIALLINLTATQTYSQSLDSSSSNNSLLDRIDRYAVPEHDDALGQVTNINQLRDVSPTDWAYEALRSLVDRYGCISGFPNQTYRGNQPLSRYEFAAGLNSCLNQIERLIASSDSVNTEDLETIQKLAQEFEAELLTLDERIDKVESQTGILEDSQFSTTTKLTGEAVFSIGDIFIGENTAVFPAEDLETEPVFGHRVRLGFNTSFTGKDLLFTQLTSGNFPFFSGQTGTFEGDLGLLADNGNNVDLLVALYSFPLSDRTTIVLEGYGGIAFDFADTISPLDHFNDSASGAISYFGVRNPIYNQVLGSGIGLKSELSDSFEFSAGYLAPSDTASNPAAENGLFNGAYSALGQLVFKPGDRFKLGLTYINSYNSSDNFAGSNLSNINSFISSRGTNVPITSNSYGVQTSFSLSDSFIISGWGGYTTSRVLESATDAGGATIVSRGDQEVWNWAVTLAFPDLIKEGNLGGIIVGMEPKVTDSTIDIAGVAENTDPDTSFHVEAFYQYQLTDNIAVTPGAVWITAPDHDEENADTVIGTLRTTFTF